MKKLFALIVALVMIAALAACAPAPQPSASSSAPASESPSQSAAASSETPAGPAGPEVLKDVRVRKALSLAIDRDKLNETIWNNSRVPAYALVSGGIADATPDKEFRAVGGDLMSSNYQENVKEAQKLLAEAGFPNGEGFPVLEYVYNTNTGHQAVAEAIQNMWKENLGIEITLTSMEWNVFQSFRKTAECQIARQGWLGDYTDPSTFFDLFTTDSGNNDGHYSNAKYDELVKAAKTEPDKAKRMQMYHDAEKIIMDDMAFIPIVFYADDVIAQTDFTNFAVTGTGLKMFWATSKTTPTVCVGAQPETLDPTMNQSVDGYIYTEHLFEGLYRPKLDGTFELGQAKDVKKEVQSDGSVKLTATLRDGIVWSDGKPVTANDFVYAWRRILDPATAAPYAYLYADFFKNGADVMNGKIKPEELSAKAVDDKTIEFEIVSDLPFTQDLLAFPGAQPLREDIVSKGADWATKTKTLITNGRYTMKTIANEDKLVMVKNDKYWDAATTTTTQITFKLMSDDNAILAAFKNKELDLADSYPPDESKALEATPEFHRYGNVGLYYLQLNNKGGEQ